jgi:mono/diheme cytochrome c family protein
MRILLLSLALGGLVLAAAPARAQAPGASPLPEGEGREIVAAACSQCHGLNAFTGIRENAQAWRWQTYDMILRGAQITPAEMDTVVKYLATNFGPGVNVPKSEPVTLADGQGKELVEGGCAMCHGLDRVVAAKRSAGEWQKIVDKMIFLGAPLSPEQSKTLTAYLTTNYGAGQKAASR